MMSWPGCCLITLSPSHGLRATFGMCCRKDWADKAAKLGAGFDIEKAAAEVNCSTLARAKKLHNTLFAMKDIGSASRSGSAQVNERWL